MQIMSPEAGEEGVTLYESWHKRDNWTNDRDAPRCKISLPAAGFGSETHSNITTNVK